MRIGSGTGNRTLLCGLKTHRPKPLDDTAVSHGDGDRCHSAAPRSPASNLSRFWSMFKPKAMARHTTLASNEATIPPTELLTRFLFSHGDGDRCRSAAPNAKARTAMLRRPSGAKMSAATDTDFIAARDVDFPTTLGFRYSFVHQLRIDIHLSLFHGV